MTWHKHPADTLAATALLFILSDPVAAQLISNDSCDYNSYGSSYSNRLARLRKT